MLDCLTPWLTLFYSVNWRQLARFPYIFKTETLLFDTICFFTTGYIDEVCWNILLANITVLLQNKTM